jgi:hypothetical protein
MSATPDLGAREIEPARVASIVSYVHALLRVYEAEAQRGVGEGERLLDLAPSVAPKGPVATFGTRLDGLAYAIACVGEALRLSEGPEFLARVTMAVESHYGWPSAALLRNLWIELLPKPQR